MDGLLIPGVVLTCAPWEMRDVLILKNCFVIQRIGQASQSRPTDDSDLWALGGTGT